MLPWPYAPHFAADPRGSISPGVAQGTLRRGWTTGACAAAAAKAAFAALRTGAFPDPVDIPLPGGAARAAFALAEAALAPGSATVGVVKDAGDDPDVTHGALVRVTLRPRAAGAGLRFLAGEGVGTVTLPGLPLPPGEPAINPGPRAMILAALSEVAEAPDLDVEVAIPGGARIALGTMNARLGILGGLSVLGTTGIVVPYSCASWIHSIHRGVDVARAAGLHHLAGATGSTSEAAVARLHALPERALIDMGDFAGGLLKYLRAHPVPRVTVAGGVAKMTKLAQGRLDLHSRRGPADLDALAALCRAEGGPDALAGRIAASNTVLEAFSHAAEAERPLGEAVARAATRVAAGVLGPGTRADVAVFDREGHLLASTG